MSTEYFIQAAPPCECCKRGYDPVRIGISAVGWEFGFDRNDDLGAHDLETWRPHLVGAIIVDEYGGHHSPEEFFAFVERKRGLRR